MDKKIFLLSASIFSILLFMQLAVSLTVKCRMGGPYVKNSTYNITINVVGQVSDASGNVANVTVNLTKGGVLIETKNITSDSAGQYIVDIKRTLDAGRHAINVSAERNGTTVYCNNETDVTLSSSTGTCYNKSIKVDGIALYSSTGIPITSGTVRLSIQGETVTNQTSFTSGQFSIILSGCLTLGKRYILQIFIDDNLGKKNWSYIYIHW